MIEKYGIYSEFDLEKHKETFINYLEVIILPSGEVKYAVPSHQEFLIQYAMIIKSCSREEINKMCPKEYYADFITWLTQITHCVAVWNDGYIGKPNRFQKKVIKRLIDYGLLK